jgi:hypothetical protein
VSGSLGRMYLIAYNSSGTEIVRDSVCSNGSGNVCARLQFTVSLAGQYFLRTLPADSTGSGTYSIRVLPRYDQGATWDAALEPDDVSALAPPISVGRGGTLNRTIEPRDPTFVTVGADEDFVRFVGTPNTTYVAEVFNVSASLGRMYLIAYNSSGTEIVRDSVCSNGSGNICSRVQFTVSLSGQYFLRVVPYSSTASGTYDIRVLPRYDQGLNWGPLAEPNDVPALAYPLTAGVAQGQDIGPRDSRFVTFGADEDYLRLPVQAGKTYAVTVRNPAPSLGYSRLYVYDSTGAFVAGPAYCIAGVGARCDTLTFTTSLSGSYFLRVVPDSSGSSGTYNICAYESTLGGCKFNVLKNSSFETDADANGRPDLWTSDSRFTRSNAVPPKRGAYSGRFAATDNSTVTVNQTVGNWPVGPSFQLTGWVNIPATSDAFTFTVRMRWRNSVNATISAPTVRTFSAATAGWQPVTVSMTAPPGTNNGQLEFVAGSLNAAVYVDDFLMKAPG